MVYSKKAKLAYYPIPRTASYSIRKVLQEYFPDTRYYANSTHSQQSPIDIEDYYKFTVVRNPYRRLISLWWHMASHGAHEFKYLRDCTFELFCRWLVKSDEQYIHSTFMNQIDYIRGIPGRLDMVLHYERIPRALRAIPKLQGKDINFPATHQSAYSVDIKTLFTDYLLEITQDYIRPDLKHFFYPRWK